LFDKALAKKQPPKGSQVVEELAAVVEVILQAVELVVHELQRFNASGGAFVLRQSHVPLDSTTRLLQRFAKQRHVLPGTFQVVKRSVGIVHGAFELPVQA
jgi:hypothetical protein